MDILADPQLLRDQLSTLSAGERRIGFVPTMGHLHDGHLALVHRAHTLADVVVVSIFINPMQFGANEDLASYPRTLNEDLEKLDQAGVDVVFTPEVDSIYPEGVMAHTKVSVPTLTDVLCGAARPGHFDGVTSVVCKLFNIVAPHVAVFGEKDLQQLIIIRKMVADLALPIAIEGVSTARADDGLALSSRNSYLSVAERAVAPSLQRVLQTIAEQIKTGHRHYSALCAQGLEQLKALGFVTDYLEIRRRDDLALAEANDREIAVFVAARLGTTRLIDNVQVDLAA